MQKTLFVILCLAGLAGTSSAQSRQDSLDLRRDLWSYGRVSLRYDLDSVLFFMPPALFDVEPEAQLRSEFKTVFDGEEFTTRFDSMRWLAVTPLAKKGGHLCAMVDYSMTIVVTLNTSARNNTGNTLADIFQKSYPGAVLRRPRPNRIEVFIPRSRLFAIKGKGWKSWKFFEDERDDDDMRPLIEKIIPKAVLDHFK